MAVEEHENELLTIVSEEIVPHYRHLSSDVKLGLWRVRDTRSYLALQFWTSRAERDAAIVSPSYEGWLRDYATRR